MTALANLSALAVEMDELAKCGGANSERLTSWAAELRATLSPAELGGVEYGWAVEIAPENVVFCKAEATARAQAFELRRAGYPCTLTPLYTTPRAAEAVTDEMVERALAAFQSKPILQRNNESWQTAMRAALTAALTPPSAEGE